MLKKCGQFLCIASAAALFLPGQSNAASSSTTALPQGVSAVYDIGKVWSGSNAAFYALKHGNIVYVAYYDENRRTTVARVDLATGAITTKHLSNVYEGWDSHNYLTLALDQLNNLHLSGNMHANPLVYARTIHPGDLNSLTLLDGMTQKDENKVVYPVFNNLPSGNLAFRYRNRISTGFLTDGATYINSWNGRTWTRIVSPLFISDPVGAAIIAYPTHFILGPDGWYHMAWTWRNNLDAATNYDVHYAKSKDLAHWYNAQGIPLALPLTQKSDTIIEKVPMHGGLLHQLHLSFDAEDRPIVSYMKYDGRTAVLAPDCSVSPKNVECGEKNIGSPVPAYILPGATQIYNARLEDGTWHVYQATKWTSRWSFGGGGSFPSKVGFTDVSLASNGNLLQSFTHSIGGSDSPDSNGTFELDPKVLAPVKRVGNFNNNAYPPILTTPRIRAPYFTVMLVPVQEQNGYNLTPSTRYFIRWEVQADMCRDLVPSEKNCPGIKPLPSARPQPSDLQLYEVTNPKTVIQLPKVTTCTLAAAKKSGSTEITALYWTTGNALSASINDGHSNKLNNLDAGSINVRPATTTAYTLTATGTNGTCTAKVTLQGTNVGVPPQ